jgi:hypothetical protein
MDTRIVKVVDQVITLLATAQYDAAAKLSHRKRLSAREIRGAIAQYGRRLIIGPPEQLEKIDAIEIRDSKPRAWSIQVPLWTKEEGRSDLTLELTVIDNGHRMEVQIDDIRVL